MKTAIAIISVAVIVAVLPAQATLWDLLIRADIEGRIVDAGDDINVIGSIVDHAGVAVPGAVVEVRLGAETAMVSTDEAGSFEHTFEGLDLLPGTHMLNIGAETASGTRGMAGVTFEVRGHAETFTHTQKLLMTPEAQRYLNSDRSDWQDNPLGLTLYDYYQDLHKRYLVELEVQKEIEMTNRMLQLQKDQQEELRQAAIDEKNPGAGTFHGTARDIYVSKIDRNVRDIIEGHLDHTVNIFEEAQRAMNEVLEQGGTREEARQAYFATAAMTREAMESLLVTDAPDLPEPVNATEPVDIVEPEGTMITVGGLPVQISMNGTAIHLSVNGTSVEFLINGTELVPVDLP